MRKRTYKSAAIVIGILIIAKFASASTFYCNKKECTKGEAIKLLANDPKAEVIKQDRMEFNLDKGTLKVKSN